MGLAPERTPTGSVYRSLTGSVELRPGGVAPPPVPAESTYCYALELTRKTENTPPLTACGVSPTNPGGYCKEPVPTFAGHAEYEFENTIGCYTALVPRNYPLEILDANGNTLINMGAWTCTFGDQTWPNFLVSEMVLADHVQTFSGTQFERIFGIFSCLLNAVPGMPDQNVKTFGLKVTIAKWDITSIDSDFNEVYISGTSHLSFLDGVSITGTANNDGLYEVEFADDEYNFIEVYPDLVAEDPVPPGATITFIGPGLFTDCRPYTGVTDLGGGLIRFAVPGHSATAGQLFAALDSSVYSTEVLDIVAVGPGTIDVQQTYSGDDSATCGTGASPFQPI